MKLTVSLTTLAVLCVNVVLGGHESHHIEIPEYKGEVELLGQHVEIPELPTKVIRITKTVAVHVPVPYPVKIKEKVPYPVHIAKPFPVSVPHIVKVPTPVHISSKQQAHDPYEGLEQHSEQSGEWGAAVQGHGGSSNNDHGSQHSFGGAANDFSSHSGISSEGSQSYDSPAHTGAYTSPAQTYQAYPEAYGGSSYGAPEQSYAAPAQSYGAADSQAHNNGGYEVQEGDNYGEGESYEGGHGGENNVGASPGGHDAYNAESRAYDTAIQHYLQNLQQNMNQHHGQQPQQQNIGYYHHGR